MNQPRRLFRIVPPGLALAVGLSLPWVAQANPAADPPSVAEADRIEGLWLSTEDDGIRSHMEIVREADGYAGRVRYVESADGQPLQPVCARCPAPHAKQPIVGMRFLWGLQPQGNGKWSGGRVMDLRDSVTQGTIANAELTLLPNGQLKLLGYLGMRALGQSRVWQRLPTEASATLNANPAPPDRP
ncbi:MAG TPA: DUF2147 domain-containing protein [Solimonas sp.]